MCEIYVFIALLYTQEIHCILKALNTDQIALTDTCSPLVGVAYRMDKVRGNCTVTKIAGSDFDAHSLDATTVRIRTAKEFFYFDKTQYAYEGVVRISFNLESSVIGSFTRHLKTGRNAALMRIVHYCKVFSPFLYQNLKRLNFFSILHTVYTGKYSRPLYFRLFRIHRLLVYF